MKYLNNISYKDCVGKVCKSLNSGDFKILKYNDKENVEIQFFNTGFKMVARFTNIKSGSIKDPYVPLVYGVGVSGIKYPSKLNGRNIKEYDLWHSMLERCYSDIYKKKYPTYEDCKCSDNFKSYEYFYEWCHNQIGFGVSDFELDKDLLVKGNKIYSENICVFIPSEINSLLTKRESSRGNHLIGVHWSNTNKAFVAQVNKGKGQKKQLGYFKTEIEAFNAYKKAKEVFIKEQANKWKGKIDERAYEALMNYEVNIDD